MVMKYWRYFFRTAKNARKWTFPAFEDRTIWYYFLPLDGGFCDNALPATVFAALPERGLLRTLDATVATRDEVTLPEFDLLIKSLPFCLGIALIKQYIVCKIKHKYNILYI